MKSFAQYIGETLQQQVHQNAGEYKEYDIEGTRKARSMSITHENWVSASQKVDLALDDVKTGYFLRLLGEHRFGMFFYVIPTEDEVSLIIKQLSESPHTKDFKVERGEVDTGNKKIYINIEF